MAVLALAPLAGQVTVRWFQPSDRTACQRIAADAAMSSYGASFPDAGALFSPSAPLEPAEVRLVATLEEEPVGFLEIVGAHISNVFVDPAHQGRGIGAALMAAAEATVPGDLTLSVFTSNSRARRFYERLGFSFEGMSQIRFHDRPADVWRLRKTRQASRQALNFDLVILDFDGVLANSAPWMTENLDEVCKRHGLRRPGPEAIERLRTLSSREIVKELGAPVWKLPAMAQDMRARMAADAGDIPLFPGAPEFLERLEDAGVQMAVVSSNSEATVRTVLGNGNAERIRLFRCGASLFGKRRLLRQVQERLEVTPGRILCVGDETRDIDAARAAGLPSAAVTWGYAAAEALRAARPNHIVGSFQALADLIGV